MTEDQWAEAEEDAIFAALRPLSARRQQLLAVALVRSLGSWADLDVVRDALAAAEKFADTAKSKAALKRARDALADARVALVGPGGHTLDPSVRGIYWALRVASFACSDAGAAAVRETVWAWREGATLLKADARRRVYPVFREVAGPDAPVAFSPSWRTDTAVLLTRQMYESRDFSAMPILADALQDAGCDHPDVLNHCRHEGPHARGCWVVDLVFGKS